MFPLSKGIIARSDFDSGNLANILETASFEYDIWTAPDNMGTPFEAKVQPYFHFFLAGLPVGVNHLKFRVCNPGIHHHSLYKQDMRPVYKSSVTCHRWMRLKRSVRIICIEEDKCIAFEHITSSNETEIYFAFTYPYSYETLQQDLQAYETSPRSSPYFFRELLTFSPEGRRIDIITISSHNGKSSECEALEPTYQRASAMFPGKEVLFISARVHPGEVPASHTMKGILDFLLDPEDVRATELRSRYLIKVVPMLNPDGVYRGR